MADIELVIKLSEEDYKIMKHNIAINNPLCPLSQEEMVSKVANGTPLPKGHGKIGDFDAFLKGFLFDKRADNLECGWIRELIEQVTIIEAESEDKE